MSDLQKVYLLKRDEGKLTFGVTSPMIEGVAGKVFQIIGGTRSYRLDATMPVVKFGARRITDALLANRIVADRQLYSSPSLVKQASSKRLFYRLLGGENMPQTVFAAEYARRLRLPIIVKPRRGWAGQGTTVITSYGNLPTQPNLCYQEHLDIAHEYRYTMVGSNPIFCAERIPTNDKALALRNGESRPDLSAERNKFSWRIRQPDANLVELAKWVMQKSGLKFAGIDLAVTNDNKRYVIEANTAPGLTHNQSVLLYEAVFQNWYGRPVDHETKQLLDMFGDILLESRKRYIRSRYEIID